MCGRFALSAKTDQVELLLPDFFFEEELGERFLCESERNHNKKVPAPRPRPLSGTGMPPFASDPLHQCGVVSDGCVWQCGVIVHGYILLRVSFTIDLTLSIDETA